MSGGQREDDNIPKSRDFVEVVKIRYSVMEPFRASAGVAEKEGGGRGGMSRSEGGRGGATDLLDAFAEKEAGRGSEGGGGEGGGGHALGEVGGQTGGAARGLAGLSRVRVVLDMCRKGTPVSVSAGGRVGVSGGGGVGVREGRVLWDLGRVGVDGLAGFSPSTGVLEAVWKAESPGIQSPAIQSLAIQSAGPPSNHSRDVLTPYAVEGTTEEADSSSDKLDDGSKPHAPTSAPIVCLQVLRNSMRASCVRVFVRTVYDFLSFSLF